MSQIFIFQSKNCLNDLSILKYCHYLSISQCRHCWFLCNTVFIRLIIKWFYQYFHIILKSSQTKIVLKRFYRNLVWFKFTSRCSSCKSIFCNIDPNFVMKDSIWWKLRAFDVKTRIFLVYRNLFSLFLFH